MTLSEFLLARIAEDEEVARRDIDQGGSYIDGQHQDRWQPARVLAECEAKRQIIDEAWFDHERIESEWGSCQTREEMSAKGDDPAVVKWLAMPYADHADYRQEWKP